MAEGQNSTVPIAAEMIRDLMAESFIKTSKRVYDISMICLIQRLLWDYCLCSSKTIIYPNEGLEMRSPKEYKMMQNKIEGVWFEGGNSGLLIHFSILLYGFFGLRHNFSLTPLKD